MLLCHEHRLSLHERKRRRTTRCNSERICSEVACLSGVFGTTAVFASRKKARDPEIPHYKLKAYQSTKARVLVRFAVVGSPFGPSAEQPAGIPVWFVDAMEARSMPPSHEQATRSLLAAASLADTANRAKSGHISRREVRMCSRAF